MGILVSCCKDTERKYELIDQIYDIQETQMFSGVVNSIIERDLSWNSLRNVIKHSTSFYVHYYVVIPDLSKFSQTEMHFVEMLKQIVMKQICFYVDSEFLSIITKEQIPKYDQLPGETKNKVVFVHLMPERDQVDIDPTQNLDIYLVQPDFKDIPDNCISLINNKRFIAFYRK